jgi:large subunit ribosomal protein L7A
MTELLKKTSSKNKRIGIKQSIKAVEEMKAQIVFIALDADNKITSRLIEISEQNNVQIEYVDTMKQLGNLCGIDIDASSAVILRDSDQ